MPNYDDYSLKELREAWLYVDDSSHPERAVEIYQRLKSIESSNVKEENPLDSLPDWVVSVISFFYRPPKFYETTFSDVLLEESNADMKEERVKKLIATRASSGT